MAVAAVAPGRGPAGFDSRRPFPLTGRQDKRYKDKEITMTTRQWRETREEEYRQAQREPVNHNEWDSIEAWAVAHGLTLDEALGEGVSQDDDGTIHIPTGLWGWLEVKGRV